MAETQAPTEALLGLLRDVDERRVLTDEDTLAAVLDLGDGTADVSQMVWAAERAGWITQPADSLVWHLTDRGHAFLDRGEA